jgi:hypothetical protein
MVRGGLGACGFAFALAFALALAACGTSAGNTPPPPPPCDAECQDETAVRALREMIKLAYNLTLQGLPVGDHDETTPCPQGGTVRVAGRATSNALQGSTFVDLTYTFSACSYLQRDTDPKQNYRMTVNGTITEKGTLAVQPSATTALSIHGDSVDLSGTVYAPPIDYAVSACVLEGGQTGSHFTASFCGREAGLTL